MRVRETSGAFCSAAQVREEKFPMSYAWTRHARPLNFLEK
jgi:hypothetical protein